MAERLVVKLDLESGNIEQTFKNLEDTAEKSTKAVEVSLKNNVEEPTDDAISTIERLVKGLAGVGTALLLSPPAGKGLFGTVSKLGAASGVFLAMSQALEGVNNETAKFVASVSKVAAVITGGLTVALTFAILKISELAFEISTNLVNAFRKISDESLKLQQSTDVLNAFIDNFNKVTNGAIGTSEQWQESIEELGNTFRVSNQELSKSSQEIVAVASQFGIAGDQLRTLLKISTEYAIVNKKEVFPTTLAIVKALAGNAQAVTALGIKLNEGSVAAFALKKGLSSNFKQLSDNEKAQIRYTKLLSQYSNIAGIAELSTNSLAEADKRLSFSTDQLTQTFAKGVSEVENFNVASLALTSVVEAINTPIVETIGTVSALGARFLQATSFIVGFSFKLFIAVKLIGLVKGAIALMTGEMLFLNKVIPLVNLSLSQMSLKLTAGRIGFKELRGGILSASGSLKKIAGQFLVTSAATGRLSILGSISQLFIKTGQSAKFLLVSSLPLLILLAKIAIAVALVVGAFKLIKAALIEVENRTGALSAAWFEITRIFNESKTVFEPFITLMGKISDAVFDVARRAFGFFVFSLSSMFKGVADLVAMNPFGAFSDQTVAKFAQISGSLNVLNERLVETGFKLDNLKGSADRAIASLAPEDKMEKIATFYGFLGQVDDEFTTKLTANAAERAAQINKANKSIQKLAKQTGDAMKAGIAQGAGNAFAAFGAALVKGENALEAFGAAFIKQIANVAVQQGTAFILQGIAYQFIPGSQALGASLIAAGAGLAAFGGAIGAAVGGGAGANVGSAGGVGGGGVTPTSGAEDSSIADADTITDRQPQTIVNINGDLFNTEESGRNILDVLNENFETQGGVLVNPRTAVS